MTREIIRWIILSALFASLIMWLIAFHLKEAKKLRYEVSIIRKSSDHTGEGHLYHEGVKTKEPEWVDLQEQVRNHIKHNELFDWHEALTGEEMTYLENLLLTYAPIFYPGSLGFERTVQPYLGKKGDEKDKVIADYKITLNSTNQVVDNLIVENEKLKKELENAESEIQRLTYIVQDRSINL